LSIQHRIMVNALRSFASHSRHPLLCWEQLSPRYDGTEQLTRCRHRSPGWREGSNGLVLSKLLSISDPGVIAVTSPGAAISPQPPGAPLAHASSERPRKSSYSVPMDLLQRISIDPAVRYGKPCVRGTRLTVELTHEDVLACLACRQASVSSPQLLMERFPSSTHVRPPRGPGPGDQR